MIEINCRRVSGFKDSTLFTVPSRLPAGNAGYFFLFIIYSSFLELIYSVDNVNEEPDFVGYSAINLYYYYYYYYYYYP